MGPSFTSQTHLDRKNVTEHLSTREIFESAARFGGETLKRLVLLGSAVSVLNMFEDTSREGKPYTEKNWNPVFTHLAWWIQRRNPRF